MSNAQVAEQSYAELFDKYLRLYESVAYFCRFVDETACDVPWTAYDSLQDACELARKDFED